MGDPKKLRKKYSGPVHPWEGARIEKEKELLQEYGLKNKKEIWKMDSSLRNFKDQAKKLNSMSGSQAEKESQQLFSKLGSLGLLDTSASFTDILGLDLHGLMDRRLQTQVHKLGLARSVDQARQFVVHQHIAVDGKKITVPSYFVRVGQSVAFADDSPMKNEMHPERIEKKPSKTKIEKKEKKESEEEVLAFKQEEILDEDEAALAEVKKKTEEATEEPVEEVKKKTEEKAEAKEEVVEAEAEKEIVKEKVGDASKEETKEAEKVDDPEEAPKEEKND